MVWLKIEQIVGENIPMCVKKILLCCGYDTMLSLQNITMETVNHIEKHVNKHFSNIVQEFDCCHGTFYKNQTVFEFLPGHRDMLITLSRALSKNQVEDKNEPQSNSMSNFLNQAFNSCFNFTQAVENHPSLPVILKEMIKTALRNAEYDKNHAQYSDIIRYFATYIYIIGGRSCYEVLYKNLPLPSVSTVCKY